VTVARADAIAAICVDERVDNDPIEPVLLLMAVCMRLAVAPILLELARAPWQEAQLLPYRVGPSVTGVGVGVGVGVTEVRADAIAVICVDVRADSEPMPPVLLLIALCMRLTVAPALLDVARAPWHEAQLLAYRVGPSVTGVGVGVGVGVTGVKTVTSA
jgi:hypothetical protein